MTTSVLRTADAWYVRTDTGAVKIDTTATTTAALLCDRELFGRQFLLQLHRFRFLEILHVFRLKG